MAKIAFQGELGANSHIACHTQYPEMEALPCDTFDKAFAALRSGEAALAMMPVENTVAGRVADIHRLLPGSKLYIVGEHFMRVNHCLLALPGTKEADFNPCAQSRNGARPMPQCDCRIGPDGARRR